MDIRRLERILTRYFLSSTLGALVLVWTAFFITIASGVSVDDLTNIVDAMFKIAAVIAGAAWALNRYFVARTDALQLKVDPAVDFVCDDSDGRIFVCRLDIINTGKSLTPRFGEALELQRSLIVDDAVSYEPFYRWPGDDLHPGTPIEPGSWSAISVAVSLPPNARLIRVYLYLAFEGGEVWTWHRHFAAPNETGRTPRAAPEITLNRQNQHAQTIERRCDNCGTSKSQTTGKSCGAGHFICADCGKERNHCSICGHLLR